MIQLPVVPTEYEGPIEPSKLLIFSPPKVGKTSLCLNLPNSLDVDLERGTKFFRGQKIDIFGEAEKNGIHPIQYYFAVAKAIKDANFKAQKKIYDFIILDTLTVLENMADELGTKEYKKSSVGKNFTGTSVTKELAKGAGYKWSRDSFLELYKAFDGLAEKCLILLAHVKVSSIDKAGDSLSAKDLNLTGALKIMVTSDMDASGYMFRHKSSSKNIISFLTEEQDLVTGSRIPALSGKQIVVSEMVDGKLVTHWEEIFPSIKPVKEETKKVQTTN